MWLLWPTKGNAIMAEYTLAQLADREPRALLRDLRAVGEVLELNDPDLTHPNQVPTRWLMAASKVTLGGKVFKDKTGAAP